MRQTQTQTETETQTQTKTERQNDRQPDIQTQLDNITFTALVFGGSMTNQLQRHQGSEHIHSTRAHTQTHPTYSADQYKPA